MEGGDWPHSAVAAVDVSTRNPATIPGVIHEIQMLSFFAEAAIGWLQQQRRQRVPVLTLQAALRFQAFVMASFYTPCTG